MNILSKLKVRELCSPAGETLLVVPPEAEVGQIVREFAAGAELRGIFVADHEDRFLGVITRIDLLDWARVRLGASLYPPYRDLEKIMRLASMIRASTAADILHPGSAQAVLQHDDSLTLALRRMIELDLIVLPVVDAEHRLIGELNLSAILAAGLGSQQQEAEGGNQAEAEG